MPRLLTSPPATKRVVATLSLSLVVAVGVEAVFLRMLARAGIYIFSGSPGGWLYSIYSSLVWLGKVAMNFATILSPLLLLVLAIVLWQRGSRVSRLVSIAVLVTLGLEGSLFLAFPNPVLSLAYLSSSVLLVCLALVFYFRDGGVLPMALTLVPLVVMFLASYWYQLVPLVNQLGGTGLGGAIGAFQLSEGLLLLVAISLPITIGISRRFKVMAGSIILTLPLLGMYLGNPSMVPLIAIWAFGISMYLPFWVYVAGLWAVLVAILTLLNRGHHLPAYGLALLLAGHRELPLTYFNNLTLVALLLIVAMPWPLPQRLGQWRWWRSSREKTIAHHPVGGELI